MCRGVVILLAVIVAAALSLTLAPVGASAATGPQSAALSQYANGDGFHWDTTGAVSSGYSLQSTLGFLQPTQTAGTVALYSCQDSSSTDVHFLSLDGTCGGQTVLGTLGYIYGSAPASVASVPLYACSDGPDQFASTAADCGGDTVVSQLGYLLLSQALDRYNGGYHWVTTGSAPSGYSLEGTLGYLVTNANGAEALYGCETSPAQFLSLDPTCEGQTVLGVEGWVYGATGANLSQLDRCQDGSDYFESTDGCEGQSDNGTLGWILGQALPAPVATTTTPTTTGSTTTPTSSPPTTTQTTPQTTTVAPQPTQPASGKKSKPRVRVRIAMSWTWRANDSRLHAIRFTKLPTHSTVTITCTGTRCPDNLGTTAASAKRKRLRLATLLAHVKRDTFRAGQRLTITIARSGEVSQRVVLRIRSGHGPLATLTG